jgi:hypothetical protein
MAEPVSGAAVAVAAAGALVKAGTPAYNHFLGQHREWRKYQDIEDNLAQMKQMISGLKDADDFAMINDLLSKWMNMVKQYRFTPGQEMALRVMEGEVHQKMLMWDIAYEGEDGKLLCRSSTGQCSRVMIHLNKAKEKQEGVQNYGRMSVNRDRQKDIRALCDETEPEQPAASCATEVQGPDAITALRTPGAYIVVTAPSWCGPCKNYEPKFENAARRSKNPYYIIREEHQANKSVIGQLKVTGFPTVLHVEEDFSLSKIDPNDLA